MLSLLTVLFISKATVNYSSSSGEPGCLWLRLLTLLWVSLGIVIYMSSRRVILPQLLAQQQDIFLYLLFFSCCVTCQLKSITKFPALQASQQNLTAMSPDFYALHPLFSSPWIVYGELGMVTVFQPGVVSTISPLAHILCGELDIQISVSM